MKSMLVAPARISGIIRAANMLLLLFVSGLAEGLRRPTNP